MHSATHRHSPRRSRATIIPTSTSDTALPVSPPTVNLVELSTWTVTLEPSGWDNVMLSPSTAVAWPTTDGSTTAIAVTV